jgi:hypothetical protein
MNLNSAKADKGHDSRPAAAARRPAPSDQVMERVMKHKRTHWADQPLWVRIGLLGVPSRRAATVWMPGVLIFAILFLIAIFFVPITVNGVAVGMGDRVLCAIPFTLLLLIVPFWCWLANSWTDEHDGWALHTWKS